MPSSWPVLLGQFWLAPWLALASSRPIGRVSSTLFSEACDGLSQKDVETRVSEVFPEGRDEEQGDQLQGRAYAGRHSSVVPCFFPLKGYRAKDPNPSGKRSIVFDRKLAYEDRPVQVPCGQCMGCRLERSRQWAVRCVHEAQLHSQNSYLTLTFNNRSLPDTYSVNVRDHQLFLKRVRKRLGPVRFFLCGEYGDINRRPHYHALLFGKDFRDKKLHGYNANGDKIYTSDLLNELWGQGNCTLGDVTFQSAAYVARYVMKKRTGENAEKHYTVVHPLTGEVVVQAPEYVVMSRGGRTGLGGIGSGWLAKFKSDVYPDDFIVLDGHKFKPPRWYDAVLERDDPKLHREMRRRRKIVARARAADNTPERLKVRHKVLKAKLSRLKREL